MRKKITIIVLLINLSVLSFKCEDTNSTSRIENTPIKNQKKEDIISSRENRKVTHYQIVNNKVIITTMECQKQFYLGMKLSDLGQLDSTYSIDSTSTLSRKWGYDGSDENAKLIFKDGELLFVCIPALGEDVIFAIVVLSEKIKFNSNISVGTSVKDIIRYFPNIKFYINIVTGNEECIVPESSIVLVFKTDDATRIGKYDNYNIEKPSVAINFTPTISYITIVNQKNN